MTDTHYSLTNLVKDEIIPEGHHAPGWGMRVESKTGSANDSGQRRLGKLWRESDQPSRALLILW